MQMIFLFFRWSLVALEWRFLNLIYMFTSSIFPFPLPFQFVGEEDEMFTVSRERALFGRARRVKDNCKKFFTIRGLSHLEDPTDNEVFRTNVVDYFKKLR